MATRRVTRILCAADPGGQADALEAIAGVIAGRDVHAIAIVGDLGGGDADSLRGLLHAMLRLDRPVYWVPGPGDAPIQTYLREAANVEIVATSLHGVHGTLAITPDAHTLVAGFGGEVSDDPDAERDESRRLRYPRWEAEYRLKFLHELEENQRMLLFSTPPAHKGLGTDGSEVLAELVNTHRPRLVVCGGPRISEMLGRSLVVAPGSLREGHYAIADLNSHELEQEQLAAGARAS